MDAVIAAVTARLDEDPTQAPAGSYWLGVLALLLLTAASSWFAVTMTRFAGVSSLWVANGLLVGALELTPRRTWKWWFAAGAAGQMVARLLVGDSGLQVFGLVAINLLECAIIAGWVRRHADDLRTLRLGAVARDSFLSTLVACAVSASLALPIVLARGASSAPEAWLTWFTAHVLGMVVVATLTVVSFQKNVHLFGVAGRRLDYFFCVLLLLLACWLAFGQQSYSLLFLALLPLLLLSFRHGLTGMVVGTILLGGISGITATEGVGSFALVHASGPVARILYWQVYIACACLVSFPIAVSMTERRHLLERVRRSESDFRLLAENSNDLVVRRLMDGRRAYVSPASVRILGYPPDEMPGPADLLHPEDREPMLAVFNALYSGVSEQATITYRARHRNGHYVWLEANAKRVVADDGPQVIYTARDVTPRVLAEQGEAAARAQLQAITQHLPAMVARFDRDARYLYANDRSRGMSVDKTDLIGKTLLELRGPKQWAELKPRVDAVLAGESPTFDTYLQYPDHRVELRAQFVPDRAPDGSIQGFYSLSFDITESKRLERALEQQARFDALTGLANRRHFEEDLEAAVARAVRTGDPMLVLSLDLDKFKQINDTLGHAAGDEVLKEFGKRISASVYDVDLVARLGGDEFVVLVQYTANAESGERIARAILAAMEPPMQLSTGPVQAATSIGVGLMQPVTSSAALMALADRALYEAKARGRNTYSLLQEGP